MSKASLSAMMFSYLIMLLDLFQFRITPLVKVCCPTTWARLYHWVYLLSDQNLDLYSIHDVFYWILPFYIIQFFIVLSGRYRVPNPPFTQLPLGATWHGCMRPLLWISYASWMWTATEVIWSQPGLVGKICGVVDHCLEGVLALRTTLLALDLITVLACWAFGQEATINAVQHIRFW